MKRTIQDVDGSKALVVTNRSDIEHLVPDGDTNTPGFDVAVYINGHAFLLDLPKLDELIAALQEARDEIVGRDASPSSSAAHADV